MSPSKETSMFLKFSKSRAYIMYNVCTSVVKPPVDEDKAPD